ncbi:MAG TPA: toll/interleukin-1 receptor domain-containing protein [Pyrinomonadaceae bacterium]|jgi:hypothetical protein
MSQRSPSFPTAHPNVLVIYHRDDAEAQAQRLIHTLRLRLGAKNVKSCYDLPPSEPFPRRGGTSDLTVVLVLVGHRWAELTKGRRARAGDARANEAVASALSSDVQLIPVLVNGASMPGGTDLPGSIDISRYASRPLRLSDARWDEDVEKLVSSLERPGVPEPKGAAGEHASDDLVLVNLRREDVINLLNALMINLGAAQEVYATKANGKGKARGGVAGDDRSLDMEKTSPPFPTADPADVVSCTVFSPPKVSTGASFMVQVFAHLPEDAAEASRLAKEAVKESEKLGSKTLDAEVGRGTKLSFDLSLPGLTIDEPSQHLIWRGRPEAVQFGVTVEKTHAPGNVIGTVRVSQDGVPFGHVKFQLTVAAVEAAAPAPRPRAAGGWVKYKKAFVSYASKDRAEVLKRAQVLARLVPDFFLDVMTLEPGERWKKGLYKQIDESDAFFLFWSTAAKQSRWVMKEVDYALARKGADESAPPEIIPMMIEGPPPVRPPRRLSHLHFNDLFLYVMAQTKRKAGAEKKGRPRKRRQP